MLDRMSTSPNAMSTDIKRSEIGCSATCSEKVFGERGRDDLEPVEARKRRRVQRKAPISQVFLVSRHTLSVPHIAEANGGVYLQVFVVCGGSKLGRAQDDRAQCARCCCFNVRSAGR